MQNFCASFANASRWRQVLGAVLVGLLSALPGMGQTQTPNSITSVSLTALGTTYTQDFNILVANTSASDATTSNVLPAGWGFTEAPTTDNAYIKVVVSINNPGGAVSLGSTNAADRALGTQFDTNLTNAANGIVASVGSAFTNNTGATITSLAIGYTGEFWRLGSTARTTFDRLRFEYSTSATSLASGTYTAVSGLDFTTPVLGGTGAARDGNAAANRTAISAMIPVSIPNGTTIYLRWTDTDAASGSDDALGIDDFSLTPNAPVPPTVTTATPSATGSTATLGGNVTAAGSAGVTDRGVVYSTTNPNPTVGGGSVTQLAIGSGTGAFNGTATVALFYTTYYVAAYATSTAGTAYGAVQTLTTGPGTIPLTAVGTAYTQNFNVLSFNASSSVTFAKNTLPQGWDFYETGVGADATYASQAGTVGTGNTYSLGTAAATDRALGSVNNIIMPAFGAAFVNNTGTTVTNLVIGYTGEQWRLGNNSRLNVDQLDFQYSTSATTLSDASGFVDFNALDFISPQVGSAAGTGIPVTLDGNLAANRTALTATLGGLSIAPGATFYLRWVDFDVTGGADDVSGIDDVSIMAVVLPAVTTAVPTSSGTTATVGGTVTNAGTPAATASGVVYSLTNATPTIGGASVTQAAIGAGTGTFSGPIVLPAAYTTYYVRAYATNAGGTSYGAVQTVTTGPGQISLTTLGTTYTQDFTALTNSGTANAKNTLPLGWDFMESVGSAPASPDATYAATTGNTGTGNTYSIGAAGTNPATDRAFGTLNGTGSAIDGTTSTLGAVVVNNTGATITGLLISYTGEQWRLGSVSRTNADRLDFQYSTTATSVEPITVTTGYTDANALDFISPHTNDGTVANDGTSANLDGNAAANRATVTGTLAVSLAPGANLVLRWLDLDVTGGADDLLGIDDFSITPVTSPTVTTNATAAAGTTATLGGNVSAAGLGSGTPDRGVVYSIGANPTVGAAGVTQVAVGSGLGTFSTPVTGLAPNTTYYVRAYANTATAGTGYGAVQTFMTGGNGIVISALNTAYAENFNTLASTGTANGKTTLPTGWDFVETDLTATPVADNTYSAGTPSTGNTYSLGGNATNPSVNPTSDRAFGGVLNSSVKPTIGALYINNTGQPIEGITITYTGEQWRLGNNSRVSTDYLNFEYSTTATSLTGSGYQPVTSLDFSSRMVGSASGTGTGVALDGNLAANRATLTATFPVVVAAGGTFYIRWIDFNAPGGADDALGIDDLSLTAFNSAPPVVDLIINTAGRDVQGNYNNVTITSTGEAVLTDALNIAGTLTVQAAGTLSTNCFALTGTGNFDLQADAILRICDPAGISSSGATGAVRLAGTRSFSPGASYEYVGTAAQATGSGLPTTVRSVVVNNPTTVALSATSTVTQGLTLTQGILNTNSQYLVLDGAATLAETETSYVLGRIDATRDLSTNGASESFGNLGLILTPHTTNGASLPGSTLVRRMTGTALTGQGSSVSATRYFDIQPATNTGLNVDMVFTYFEHELNGVNETQLLLFKSDNGTSGPWVSQRNGFVRNPAGNNVTTAAISSFSVWTLGNTANPLPVELLNFTAQVQGRAVQLIWHTASEKGNAYFAVERSLNGKEFIQIGQVAAQGKAASVAGYLFLDDNLAAAPAGQLTAYYRLRQVDQDGTATYSPVRALALGQGMAAHLAAYPTVVADGQLYLSYQGPALAAGDVLEVYSLTGQLLSSRPAAGLTTLAVPNLAAGSYLLRLRTAQGSQQARFFVR